MRVYTTCVVCFRCCYSRKLKNWEARAGWNLGWWACLSPSFALQVATNDKTDIILIVVDIVTSSRHLRNPEQVPSLTRNWAGFMDVISWSDAGGFKLDWNLG